MGWDGNCNRFSGVFPARSGCITQLHVQILLIKAFLFEGEEEEEERKCGLREIRAICRRFGYPKNPGSGGMRVTGAFSGVRATGMKS